MVLLTGLLQHCPVRRSDHVRAAEDAAKLIHNGRFDLAGGDVEILRDANALAEFIYGRLYDDGLGRLPERFDDSSGGIGLSVSSKAHLFMFSGRPTVVYSSPETGLARYAREQGWADLVDRADDAALAEALARLVTDREHRAGLVRRALEVATANHDMGAIRGRFYDLLRAPR